jgi:RNase P/RNase MRP subunit p30
MEEILNSNDERATKLIEARRKYTFPAFLAGDPQEHEYSA